MTDLHGFKLVEERHIPEVNSNAKLYQHIKTGAELLSLENDDENKSFMVTLVTPPSDDTGIAHILEHSVLAGSKKYPVKEPFVQLLKTSVNTFLNAMTSSDMTMYPVASTNLQDFYNLVDVYMDAVFFPLINEQTFMQEGWHLEAEDENAPLSYKGVVFNEMKAAFSAPDTYMNFITDRTLWTDSPYKYSSGGLPAAITDLTYEQFKNFHETYYHPSNARFVFSGNDDAETRLRLVDDIISQFDARDVDAEIALQTPFSEPITVVEGYDAGETPQNGNGTMVSVNWLLPEQNDSDLIYDLSLLSHALVSTSASPLRKALIDSGLGEGLTGSGLGTSSRQATFAVGLKGVKEEDAEKVSTFIMETLGNIAEEGIDKETVKASLNTIEFNMRERNYGSFPRGLANAIIAMRPWIYGGNPLDTLSFDADFEALKQRIANDEDYLESLIDQYLLDNSHRATVIMNPDETVGTERDEAEQNRLDKTKETLNTDDIQKLIEVQNDLLTLQQTPDDPAELAKIPTLKLEDIEREVITTEQEVIEQDGTRIYFHNQPTGGIVYLQVGMNLRTVPADLLPYVELFGESLTRMGTTSEDFVRLTQRIGSKTGGVGANTSLSTKRDGSDYVAYMMVGGKTMHDQSQDLLSIIQDILLTVNLDNQSRFKQIVLERKVRAERFVNYAGHAVASGRIRAQLSETAWASDILSGTEHLFFLRDLVEKVDSDWDNVLASLEAIRDLLVNREQMVVNVTMEEKHWAGFKTQLDSFLTALPKKSLETAQWSTADDVAYEALTLPAQVSFNAKVANLYELGYELDGSISVITKHLSREYIWQHIRVMGGAYGGNISFSPSSGIIGYLSWRDPNISKTLETFNGTADYLINLEMSDEDVEKAVIGAIGTLDSYDLPDAKGRKAFMRHLLGYTDEMRQAYRDQVLDTTIDDFKQFGAILEKISDDQARFATVTSADSVPTASEEIGVEFKVTKLQ